LIPSSNAVLTAGRPTDAGQRLHDSERARLVGGSARLGCHPRGRCKGHEHASGGMEVMQAPGASLDETQPHGNGAHESGHPARLNSRSILKRHSRLKLPKSSSGSVPCQSKAPTRALSIREKAAKFLPHPPTAAENSYCRSQVSLSRSGSDGWSPPPAYVSPKGFGRAWPDLTPGLGSPTQASQSSDGWPPPLLCRPRVIGVNVPFGHCPLGFYRPGLTSRWVVPPSVNWLVTRV